MSVADYTSKINDICDSLASIDVNVEEGEMVQILAQRIGVEVRSIPNCCLYKGEYPPFFDLQSMLLVEENHVGASTSMHADNKMLTWGKIDLVVVEGEASRCTMEAADVSKEEGIVVMPTTIPDPPKAGGVEAAPRTGKGNPPWNAGIVAKRATRVLEKVHRLGENRI